jgi:hypothetical protein
LKMPTLHSIVFYSSSVVMRSNQAPGEMRLYALKVARRPHLCIDA